jgi:two-component system, NtrC family, C4-dicarboxylate transport response regulator DctD
MISRVLLVDDDKAVRDALGQTLELADLTPTLAGSYIEAKDHIGADFDGVVVTDLRMPGRDGFHLLEHVRSCDPELPVILLTGEGDIPTAVRGMSAGAFDFLEKPCAPADFLAAVQKALATRALVLENRTLKSQLRAGDAAARMLRGTSALAQALRNRIRSVAAMQAEVLVTGPTGSGTAKVAEVIHLLSARSARGFRKLSAAAATPDTLAQAWREAEGGTLFLDEVCALPAASQFALLDLLETARGVRLIAGTYRDIDAMLGQAQFNPDLFYKLDVMRVTIPALRERPEDIPVLFRHYVALACEQAALSPPEITSQVISGLMARDWSGNARALMNAAMRFALGFSDPGRGDSQDLGLSDQMALVERSLLIAALERHGGNATRAALALKLPRKTFYDKLARHELHPEAYRRPV